MHLILHEQHQPLPHAYLMTSPMQYYRNLKPLNSSLKLPFIFFVSANYPHTPLAIYHAWRLGVMPLLE